VPLRDARRKHSHGGAAFAAETAPSIVAYRTAARLRYVFPD
jgi:hypothetical protein